MTEIPQQARNESTNWLTVFPTKTEGERNRLNQLLQEFGDFPDTQQIVMTLSDVIDSGMLHGQKVSKSDVDLFKTVLAFITQGIELGVDEAVSLRLRRITDSEIKKQGQEVWSYYSGDYRGQLIGESEAQRKKYPLMPAETGNSRIMRDETYVPHEHPGDTVHFLNHRIEQLLAQKRTEPVVFVDIGAMYGMTLLELADRYRTEILEGKLILIATNIGLMKEAIETVPKPRNGTGLYENYENLYQKASTLVHFLVTDVQGLTGKKINLPNGEEFTLQHGSVDIVHENWSISKHSKSLEYDVAQIAALVGKKGMVMSNRHNLTRGGGGLSASEIEDTDRLTASDFSLITLSQAHSDELREDQEKFKTRSIHTDILLQSNKTLANHGFTLVEEIRNPYDHQKHQLNYSFWLGKNTEPLALFDTQGHEFTVDGKEKVPSFTQLFRRIFKVA